MLMASCLVLCVGIIGLSCHAHGRYKAAIQRKWSPASASCHHWMNCGSYGVLDAGTERRDCLGRRVGGNDSSLTMLACWRTVGREGDVPTCMDANR